MSNTEILTSLRKDERGATAIEYGLIAALVSVVAIGAMQSLANGSDGVWTTTSNKVQTAVK